MRYNNTSDLFIYYHHPVTGDLRALNGWNIQEIGARDAYGNHPEPLGWATVDDCEEDELRTEDMYLVYNPDGDGHLRCQLWREVQYPDALSGEHMVGWSMTDIEKERPR